MCIRDRHIADTCEDAELAAALHDIWDTPVTPELLPIGDEGELLQKSEDSVGPYILQDFFLWHMVDVYKRQGFCVILCSALLTGKRAARPEPL